MSRDDMTRCSLPPAAGACDTNTHLHYIHVETMFLPGLESIDFLPYFPRHPKGDVFLLCYSGGDRKRGTTRITQSGASWVGRFEARGVVGGAHA